ncbi:MAG: APC family permease [Actinobacteria bacterium]|nr:APC family permease [Actinomycetota bacterium]
MSSTDHSPSMVEHTELRKGRLSVGDTVAQSLGFVAPVMGIAYLTPLIAGSAGKGAGGATPLAMLLGGIGVLCIGLTVAQFARKYPHAGSIYEYVSRRFGAYPGFLAGWTYMIAAMFLFTAVLPGIGGFIQGIFGAHNISVPWWPWALGALVIGFILQYRDIRFATRIQLWIIFIASGIVLIFAIYVIIRGGAEGLSFKPFLPSSSAQGMSGVFFGLIFAFLTYSGFEASAVLSEETKDARRVIALTVIASVGIILAYFVITVYAEAISYGPAKASTDWIKDSAPLFTMGSKFGGAWLVDILSVAAVVDALAVSVATCVTFTRMLYALSRDGILPRIFSRTHRTHKTPVPALYLSAVLGIVFIVLTHLIWRNAPADGPPTAILGFSFGGGAGGLGLILIYLVLSIAGFTLDWNGNWAARIIFPLVGVVLTAFAVYYSLTPVPPPPAKWMPYTMGGFIIIGAILGLVAYGRRVPAMLSVDAQVKPEIEGLDPADAEVVRP